MFGDDMKKNVGLAFTLAEVMIVLIVIGILIAVLLPFARQLTPSEEIIKFQKANQALMAGIKSLVGENGDLGLDKNGEVITNPKYFCNALANLMNVKSVNCSDDNLGYNTSAAAFMEDFAADKFSDGTSIMDTADCICKNHTTSGEEIILGDGTIFYTVNPYYHFGFKNPEDHSRVFTTKTTEKQYKYMCIDIDGINKGQDPFGYAISADGKIILGSRASIWVNKDMQGEIPNEDEISSIDSCALVSYNEESCGEAAAKITLGANSYCITKYNVGDHPDLSIPSTVTIATSKLIASEGTYCDAEAELCCWQGVTGAGDDGINSECTKGEYCCNSTVCNEAAAKEICSKLTYKNKTWRLIKESEVEQMATLASTGQIEFEDIRTVPDSSCGYSSRCIGAEENACRIGLVWFDKGSIGYSYMAYNGSVQKVPLQQYDARFVRCIADF